MLGLAPLLLLHSYKRVCEQIRCNRVRQGRLCWDWHLSCFYILIKEYVSKLGVIG